MRQQQPKYAPGTNVFAKLKGYPWWPARIEPDQAVPPHVLKQRAKTKKGTLYTVIFYGTKDYGFFGPDAIRPFDSFDVENDLKANKFKSKDLEFAVRQALNPSLVENTDHKVITTKKKTRRLIQKEEEDGTKKRRISESMESEDDFKNTKEYKEVYLIRHRLQRLVYNKQEGEIPIEDYPKILSVVKEIEEIPLTYHLLKETKLGKVVKAACAYDFMDDGEIKSRCHQLVKNWKSILIEPQR